MSLECEMSLEPLYIPLPTLTNGQNEFQIPDSACQRLEFESD